MSDYKIFYSWQNDSPPRLNRTFIREAIDRAVKNVHLGDLKFNVRDSDRIDVDEGLQGTPGSPEVATTLFEKIAESAIFIGDVTLIGHTKPELAKAKHFPNPNVLLEQGFAAAELGWNRVVAVINEHFGSREMLPFDMRNRRFPIAYALSLDTPREQKTQVRSRLVKDLETAIKAIREADLRKASKTFSKLDVHSFELAFALADMDSFYQPPQPDPKQNVVALKDHEVWRQCVLRFLDLGLIQAHYESGRYAYHWTFLGTEVIKLVFNAGGRSG